MGQDLLEEVFPDAVRFHASKIILKLGCIIDVAEIADMKIFDN